MKVRARTEELAATRSEVIRYLGRAAEYRDNETGMHIVRMSRYCGILARSFGLSRQVSDWIEEASPMHDVGKIAVPDHILLKPGRLNDEERLEMQKHAALGAQILDGRPWDVLKMARTIALTHHEKWDGSGYPSGIAGEEIPIEGRIAAICDVFDALTSVRPYKEAWEVEKAVSFLEERAGKDFDPALVAQFKSVLPDILKVKDEFRDE